MHLIDADDLLDRLLLADNHSTETQFQGLRVSSRLLRIQRDVEPFHFVYRLSTASGGHLPRLSLPPNLRQFSCHLLDAPDTIRIYSHLRSPSGVISLA